MDLWNSLRKVRIHQPSLLSTLQLLSQAFQQPLFCILNNDTVTSGRLSVQLALSRPVGDLVVAPLARVITHNRLILSLLFTTKQYMVMIFTQIITYGREDQNI